MKNGEILVSGAGIAGPTIAYWLDRHGFTPTVIETAPQCGQEASPSTSVVQARMS
jgi:2-polyprenyl-6-methoxyphenol hydroxylase-like FAD-dependent oxidoreductase